MFPCFEIGQQLMILKDKAEVFAADFRPFFFWRAGQIFSRNDHAARIGRKQHSRDRKQRAFPRAGRTDNGGKFTFFYAERNFIQYGMRLRAVPKRFRDFFQLQYGSAHSSPPPIAFIGSTREMCHTEARLLAIQIKTNAKETRQKFSIFK